MRITPLLIMAQLTGCGEGFEGIEDPEEPAPEERGFTGPSWGIPVTKVALPKPQEPARDIAEPSPPRSFPPSNSENEEIDPRPKPDPSLIPDEPLGTECGVDFNEGDYFCDKMDRYLKICTEAGWEQVVDCYNAEICDVEEGACYDTFEEKICSEVKSLYYNEASMGEGVGKWTSTARNFSDASTCEDEGRGFPVHDRSLGNLDVVTSARFAVPPETDQLAVRIFLGGFNGTLRLHVDGIESVSPLSPVGCFYPHDFLLQGAELLINSADPNSPSVTEDGQVEIAISGIDSPRDSSFTPYLITLAECHVEERRWRREPISEEE